MTNSTMPDGSAGVPDTAVSDIIRRAVELDSDASSRVSVARLREIAHEAGVSPHALSTALAEYERALVRTAHPARHVAQQRRWRKIIAANAMAFLGAASGIAVLGPIMGMLHVPSYARGVLLLGVLALTAVAARRAGARGVQLLALGFVVSTAIEFVTSLRADWILHGWAAQSALLASAVVGVAVGALYGRQDAGRPDSASPVTVKPWPQRLGATLARAVAWWRLVPESPSAG